MSNVHEWWNRWTFTWTNPTMRRDPWRMRYSWEYLLPNILENLEIFANFEFFVKILRCSIYRMSTKNFSFSIFEPQFVILEEKSRKNQLG